MIRWFSSIQRVIAATFALCSVPNGTPSPATGEDGGR